MICKYKLGGMKLNILILFLLLILVDCKISTRFNYGPEYKIFMKNPYEDPTNLDFLVKYSKVILLGLFLGFIL